VGVAAVGEPWGEQEGKGLIASHTAPVCDGTQVVLARRRGAVASSPALRSNGGPARLGDAAHSPTAAPGRSGDEGPRGVAREAQHP